MNIILRRRRLGYTSCLGIRDNINNQIRVVRHDRGVPENTALAFRWGCTATLPTRNVVNTARAIHLVNDKRRTRLLLDDQGIGSLQTWGHIDEYDGGFPAIVRRNRHSRGRYLHVCNNRRELRQACNRYNRYYISPFVDKTEEYRVYCIQGRVACVAGKRPGNPDDVAWNVAQGGAFFNVRWGDWNLRAVRIALEAYNQTGLDFGGVDVMVDEDNEVYVLEINSAPSLTSNYRQQCFGKCFNYIIENGKEHIPLIDELGGWRKFIHPAISNEAQLV